MDYKKIFEQFEGESGFIKVTVPAGIDSSQKAALNRKGNILFNSGDIEGAKRIFQTTGYSDGLSRVGDYYKSQNRLLEALQMYWIAPDRTKSEPLVMHLAELIQQLIYEEEGTHDE
jgi:tetratricopeptide (TPR) repeat protein